jgi:hypothetical protein
VLRKGRSANVIWVFVEGAGRLVIFSEFEMALSKIFRHFRLPLIWLFFLKKAPLPYLQQNFILGGY